MKGTVQAGDPPEHTRVRALLSDKLTPKALAGLRTRITPLTDGLCPGPRHRRGPRPPAQPSETPATDSERD